MFTLWYGSAVTHVVRQYIFLLLLRIIVKTFLLKILFFILKLKLREFKNRNKKKQLSKTKVCENLPHAKVILLKPSDKIVKPQWM